MKQNKVFFLIKNGLYCISSLFTFSSKYQVSFLQAIHLCLLSHRSNKLILNYRNHPVPEVLLLRKSKGGKKNQPSLDANSHFLLRLGLLFTVLVNRNNLPQKYSTAAHTTEYKPTIISVSFHNCKRKQNKTTGKIQNFEHTKFFILKDSTELSTK